MLQFKRSAPINNKTTEPAQWSKYQIEPKLSLKSAAIKPTSSESEPMNVFTLAISTQSEALTRVTALVNKNLATCIIDTASSGSIINNNFVQASNIHKLFILLLNKDKSVSNTNTYSMYYKAMMVGKP